ncbi:hypothetical protein AP9108_08220 [Arthrospira sp. PCC 9108]|nr:hypothetical protein AP9108_08220 [Arthrospira sp. PCC 9108]
MTLYLPHPPKPSMKLTAATTIRQYSTDGDTTWVDFPTVSETDALLLDGSSQVRFVPNPDYYGEATYNFRAWDQSDGLSVGTTADVSTNGAPRLIVAIQPPPPSPSTRLMMPRSSIIARTSNLPLMKP